MTTPDTAVRRDPRRIWAAARGPLAIVALIVVVAVVLAAFADRTNRAALDPTSIDESGSRALARLVTARGVRVDIARSAADIRAAGSDATVLVPFPSVLSAGQVDAVRSGGADTVLVQPHQDVLDALAPGVVEVGGRSVDVVQPGCDLDAARAAGPAALRDTAVYTAPSGAPACYPTPDGSAVVQLGAGTATVTVLGSTAPLTNRSLAEEGNAALTMRLLGRHPRLVWFLPVPEGLPVDQQRSVTELIPAGWRWGALPLLTALLLTIVWRARRLGPVVAEPLPVVVRAAEAVEGRALLYRRAQARGHATDVLRRASRTRLSTVVGLPTGTGGPGAPAPELVAAVAARSGRPAGEVTALLYGPAPGDDAAMIDVAVALDTCEKEVRRS